MTTKRNPGVWFENADEVLSKTQNLKADGNIDGTALLITDLPTSDPSVAGQLWSNSGVLTVSAG